MFTPKNRLPFLAVLSALAIVACSDDSTPGESEDAAEEVDAVFDPGPDIVTFDTAETQAPETTTTAPDSTTTTPPEETTAPDTDSPDTSGVCDSFGCPCSSNGECLDELCIEGPDGNICTRTCIADCPADFDCLAVTNFGTDPISVCVPRHTRLCRPCRADAECDDPGDPFPAYCLANPDDDPAGASGRFCGSSCANRACPEGYSCEDVPLGGGGTARQCVPTSGECVCRSSWADLGYSTDCFVSNTFGDCGGTRSCTANGLSPCLGQQATPEVCDLADNNCDGEVDNLDDTPCMVQNEHGQCPGQLGCSEGAPTCLGPQPLAETCNGLDDDCDGATDEATCNDNLACTTDTCAAPNECENALIEGSCLVKGACYLAGQFNPLNPCEVCDPTQATGSLSQATNTCVINGACYPANTINPQNACQICQPGLSATDWSDVSNTCQIGGECYAANQANPLNPCEVCSPISSTTSWTQAFNTCSIQGECFAAGVKNPGNECLVCDPSKSATGWSNAPATQTCDDGSPCSAVSFCDGAGTCEGDTSCDDGIICTVDTCGAAGCDNSAVTAGYCRISDTCYTDNTANPTNPCERCAPTTSQGAWSPQPTNVGCNDGLFCTTDDHCDGAGGCTGNNRTCGDALTCTTDSCDERSDQCVNTLQASRCLISNSCYLNNDTQPNNVCYKCDSAANTGAWSLNNGVTCNDGNSCTSPDTCSGGTCSGPYIRDSFETNDSSTSPYNLGNYKDSQDFPQRTITSPTISGPNDVDWYVYFVDDTAGGDIEPYVKVTNVNAGLNIELCIYFRCTNKDKLPDNLDCGGGGGSSTSNVTYGGKSYKGCCTNKTGGGGNESMRFEASTFGDSEMECPSADDDFRALVRVRSTNSNYYCTSPYTMEIGDD